MMDQRREDDLQRRTSSNFLAYWWYKSKRSDWRRHRQVWRGHIWTHIPGSKVYEDHFYLDLDEATNVGHLASRNQKKVTVLNIPKSYSSPAQERPCCIPSTECGTVRVYEQ
jgi:hypothetical protein